MSLFALLADRRCIVGIWNFHEHSIVSVYWGRVSANKMPTTSDFREASAERIAEWSDVRLEVTCNKDRGKGESVLLSLPFRLLFKPINVARSFSSTLSFGCWLLAITPAGPADQASVCCNGASAALRHGPFGLLFKHRLMPLISVGVALQACLPIWSELCVNL